ncbi:hypothetical protein ABW19_dt0201711 [Dactylella cylindrospora]|nr:hypothetical protein ABW19_dt0201711 [Dactylella cylindrospora]
MSSNEHYSRERQAAGLTPGGQAEYCHFLHTIDEASKLGHDFTLLPSATETNSQGENAHERKVKAFRNAMDSHILPFLEKYHYPDVYASVQAADDKLSRLILVPLREGDDETKKSVTVAYIELAWYFSKTITLVGQDFGGTKAETSDRSVNGFEGDEGFDGDYDYQEAEIDGLADSIGGVALEPGTEKPDGH